MPSNVETFGAVDTTVIREEVVLVDHKVLDESTTTPGSEMLLLIVLSINSSDRGFLVGGYWSTKGFTMSMMTLVSRTAPIETKHAQRVRAQVYGVALSKATAVQQDLVQRIINELQIGRPENPAEPFAPQSAENML